MKASFASSARIKRSVEGSFLGIEGNMVSSFRKGGSLDNSLDKVNCSSLTYYHLQTLSPSVM